MEKLSSDPCWLVLALQTQPALCAVWSVTSSNFYSRKSFLKQLQSECQKIISWYANKEIIYHRKDFSFPLRNWNLFCHLEQSHLQALLVLLGKCCPNLITLAVCVALRASVLQDGICRAAAEIPAEGSNSLITPLPTKTSQWEEENSWQTEMEPDCSSPSSWPAKCLSKAGGILNGVSGSWEHDLWMCNWVPSGRATRVMVQWVTAGAVGPHQDQFFSAASAQSGFYCLFCSTGSFESSWQRKAGPCHALGVSQQLSLALPLALTQPWVRSAGNCGYSSGSF